MTQSDLEADVATIQQMLTESPNHVPLVARARERKASESIHGAVYYAQHKRYEGMHSGVSRSVINKQPHPVPDHDNSTAIPRSLRLLCKISHCH